MADSSTANNTSLTPIQAGGGVGFNMRDFGVASDLMLASEIVTADGAVKTLDAGTNADLFWACRGGGGGNFGVSTAFSLNTFPAEPVTVFSIVWENATSRLAQALLDALSAGPDKLGSRASLQADDRGGVKIDLLGQLKGSPEQLAGILRPAYDLAKPSKEDIKGKMDYWEAQVFLEEAGDAAYYQERSGYIRSQSLPALLEKGFEWLKKAPPLHGTRDLRFFQTGGAIKRKARDETAYVHRDDDWLMVVGLYWNAADDADRGLVERAHAWQDGFYGDLAPSIAGSYQNFPDPSLADWRGAYYLENYARLKRVKTVVDAHRLFRFAQGV